MRICLYGAASDNIAEIYKVQTERLGEEMAKSGHSLIYGAGSTGLMGAAARGFAKGEGKVVGVTPHFMHDIEDVNDNCTTLINTETMAERKSYMENNADAFIIVPGGIGTYDEFFQILTLKQLDRTDKPIVIFNIEGHYDTMLTMIEKGILTGFIAPEVAMLFKVFGTVEEIVAEFKR